VAQTSTTRVHVQGAWREITRTARSLE